jgi:hypothetical protein
VGELTIYRKPLLSIVLGTAQTFTAGAAFYEPANKVIARFDNASATAPPLLR